MLGDLDGLGVEVVLAKCAGVGFGETFIMLVGFAVMEHLDSIARPGQTGNTRR